jgi:hypothetical protein
LGPSAVDRVNNLYPKFLNSGFVKRDDDGFRFINYMMCISDVYQPSGDTIIANMGGTGLEAALEAHKRNIEYGLSNYKLYVNKYYWLATYHNNYIKDHIRLKNKESYLINLESA